MKNLWNKIRTIAAILLIGTFPVLVAGCAPSTSQIAADGQAVATALLSIANIEAVSNPQLAQNLTTAANALSAATANWKTGGSVAILNNAANAVEIALAAIPQTAAIAPLVAVAVAALDAIIANINPTSSAKDTVRVANLYRGEAHIHHRWGRSIEGDFKAAWNMAARSNPALNSAVLK